MLTYMDIFMSSILHIHTYMYMYMCKYMYAGTLGYNIT